MQFMIFHLIFIKLYLRRGKYVRPGRETDRWKQLSYHFMTQESGGEGDHIVKHELPWRSQRKYCMLRFVGTLHYFDTYICK